MNGITGLVLQGINNIYTVSCDRKLLQCRIKGKVLGTSERMYNPIAPGDLVQLDQIQGKYGLITGVLERRNRLIRWNMKRKLPQLLAANIDAVICVTSVDLPPFRPRFIDRVLVCAGDIPTAILVNKDDLSMEKMMLKRLDTYRDLGYPVLRVSAATGAGFDSLKEYLQHKQIAVVGQSGVGKSSIINRLIPDAEQRTGDISVKYNRGRHTTNFATLIDAGTFSLIDTPGIREIQVPPMLLTEIGSYYPEIATLAETCRFQPCLHRDEPDCAVRAAVGNGKICTDRYESYLRIVQSIEELQDEY